MNSNYIFPTKLFISLMILAFVPFMYQLVRTNLIADIPNTNAFGIAGHIEWFDLIDETLQAFLIVPLYALFNKVIKSKDKFKERIGQAAIISIVVYIIFSIIILIKCERIVKYMEADINELEKVTIYLRLETIGFIISIFASIASVLFVLIEKEIYIYILLSVRVLSTIFGDLVLIPSYGVNGVALSNIFVNILVAVLCIVMLAKENLLKGLKFIPSKEFIKEYIQVGIFSGGEIFLNNIIYAFVVCRMINEVSEQGNYWVANNVIWGLMLIPVNALSEIIKKDCRDIITKNHFRKYIKVLQIMFICWLVFLLILNPFLRFVMGIENPQNISHIIYTVILFYIAYSVSQVINSIFIGKGKTVYNMIISLIVNLIYYPAIYLMVIKGIFVPSIEFICYMFGFGMLLNMILGMCLYHLYRLKFNPENNDSFSK